MKKRKSELENYDIPVLSHELIQELNSRIRLGAYLGSVTNQENHVVRFNNPKIPSILVATSHLNEIYMYKYNICKKQKYVEKRLIGEEWIYYFPFVNLYNLVSEMTIYKKIATQKL